MMPNLNWYYLIRGDAKQTSSTPRPNPPSLTLPFKGGEDQKGRFQGNVAGQMSCANRVSPLTLILSHKGRGDQNEGLGQALTFPPSTGPFAKLRTCFARLTRTGSRGGNQKGRMVKRLISQPDLFCKGVN